MRTKLFAVLAAVLVAPVLVQPAVAWADGPSGSKEDKKNEVKCKGGTNTPAGFVYAGGNGIETCSDNQSSPDGRVIVDFSKQYISVDGDKTNGSGSDGFVRLDSSGPSCGDAKHTDSSKGKGAACG